MRTRRWRPDEKALANKHGRDDYLSFRITHHFVHGTSASAQRYSQNGDVILIGGPAADATWEKPAVLFAGQSLVYTVGAICTIFGRPPPPELDELHGRLEAADAELKKATA